jgi:hypothetical protein
MRWDERRGRDGECESPYLWCSDVCVCVCVVCSWKMCLRRWYVEKRACILMWCMVYCVWCVWLIENRVYLIHRILFRLPPSSLLPSFFLVRYSFSYNTMYIDAAEWRITNLPGRFRVYSVHCVCTVCTVCVQCVQCVICGSKTLFVLILEWVLRPSTKMGSVM